MRTVGVEEELLLVDVRTAAPTAVAQAVLTRPDRPTTSGGGLEAELQQQQIELETAPTEDLGDLSEQLRGVAARAADERAQATGSRAVALATSPLPVVPELTRTARYQDMEKQFGLTTSEQLTGGCHVHVGVADDDEGVAVLDRIRIWLPLLLAISANSPYWQGLDSGYASFRSQAWSRLPSAGPTQVFGSSAAYRERVAAAVASGVLLDRGMIYYDARLSHKYPTVELRVSDVCLYAEDAVLIAGLARALVETAAREAAAGQPAPEVSTELLRLACWRAGRSALTGDLLDPYASRPRPAPELVAMLLDHVSSALVDAGDADRVTAALERVGTGGTGADIQRRLAASTKDLAGVTRAAAEITQGSRE